MSSINKLKIYSASSLISEDTHGPSLHMMFWLELSWYSW